MSHPSDNANLASAAPEAEPPALGVEPTVVVSAPESNPDHDPLQVLLQASAAAERLQQRFTELQAGRAELTSERQQLNAERDAFERRAREFAEQVAQDRSTQREVQAEFDETRRKLQQSEQRLEEQHADLSRDRNLLAGERTRMQETVEAEVARERESLVRQQDALDQERKRLAERLSLLESEHGERLQQVEETLDAERDTMRETIRKELATELDQLHRERHEWDTRKEIELREIQQQSDDLQQQRELFGEQLEHEQQRLREEIEKRKQMLLSEQNNLQRRYRFQFEHLARAREDFEVELRELRRDQQLFRSERGYFNEQHQLRFAQLQRLRSALSEHETSILREQKVIDRNRVSADLELKRKRDRLTEHQTSIMQEFDARNRRLQQAEQASAETSQRAEKRLQHVNLLRAELDTKQREILEQRMMLEELQNSTQQASLPAEHSSRYKQAQKAVESFFQQLHNQLKLERDRLEEKAAELTAKQEQFRLDREELQQWFVGRQTELAANNVRDPDAGLVARITSLEDQLSQTREKLLRERKDAEQKTRNLLHQIESSESAAFKTQRRSRPNDTDHEQRSAA